jgi:hypothetical protein
VKVLVEWYMLIIALLQKAKAKRLLSYDILSAVSTVLYVLQGQNVKPSHQDPCSLISQYTTGGNSSTSRPRQIAVNAPPFHVA